MPTRSINLRSTLLGECATFLAKEGMDCVNTQKGLVELINELVNYKEEGKSLYPEIYILDNLGIAKQMLPNSQFHFIGEGEKTEKTMLMALKKCAPLTEEGWSIYILRTADKFQYGVFQAGATIMAVSISETLLNNQLNGSSAILIHQVADKIIEMRGRVADSLIVSLGTHGYGDESPTANQHNFIEKIIEGVEDALKEPMRTFFRKLFLRVLQKGHGTLACVISSTKKIPKKLTDGTVLAEKIDLAKAIKDVQSNNDLLANSIVEGLFSLILGMMQSDGITVFTNRGEVAAYNIFVKHPKTLAKSATSGGARSRTYLTLCDSIGKDIVSAYIQSQDGNIKFE